MTVVKVEKLSKKIKDKEILRNISFEINDGECVALIGPNGAGKTTLLDCLLGDKLVTSGQVSIQGLPVTSSKLDYTRAYLPQENIIVQKLKVKELIAFFQRIYPNPLSNQEIDQLLQFVKQQKEQLAEKLSGGQKRLFSFILTLIGLSFILTLIGRPKIVFLDEPTASMDTSTRQRFWEIVQELKAQGVTILYSSHYIEEVEHTADRILLLNKGELIRDTTPLAMRSEEIEKHFILPIAYKEVVEQSNLVENWTLKQDSLQVVTREADAFWELLAQAGCRMQEIEVNNRSLLNTIFEETQKGDN
ncbi:TPA: ABC transporter ATP-binding protein [Streptococcus pneumoniae]